jgi:PAS domain S-box-containing protein
MRDDQKTKAELLQELGILRGRVCELKQAKEALKHSEKQFKELFENAVVGVYRTAPDGRIIMANQALVRMLGYSSSEELSQRNLKKEGFAPGHSRSIFKDLIEKEGKVVGLESAWLRRDGTTLFITENARVIRDESGKTLCYEGIVQDITDRKKSERELRNSQELLEKTFRSLDSAVFILDSEKPPHIVDCNPAAVSIFGYERSRMLGKTTGFLHVDRKTLLEFQEVLYPAVATQGYLSSFEFRMKRKNGRIFPTEHSVFPLKNDEGDRIGWVSVIRDFTEHKEDEKALKESEEKFRLAMEITNDALWDWNMVRMMNGKSGFILMISS